MRRVPKTLPAGRVICVSGRWGPLFSVGDIRRERVKPTQTDSNRRLTVRLQLRYNADVVSDNSGPWPIGWGKSRRYTAGV